MTLQIKSDLKNTETSTDNHSQFNEQVFSKDYVDFLNEAGWRLEKKLPSNCNYYSDLLEDTDWKSNNIGLKSTRHFRRDLDALS
tara:strand:+ start:6152 stop:6403 length:252 start_codon:yes stop_codon:yes gene_type:complete